MYKSVSCSETETFALYACMCMHGRVVVLEHCVGHLVCIDRERIVLDLGLLFDILD